MGQTNEEHLAPVAIMAAKWGLNRERLLRAIMSGQVRGEQRFGRWLVDVRDADVVRSLVENGRGARAALDAAVTPC